jgi:hypothetical protein
MPVATANPAFNNVAHIFSRVKKIVGWEVCCYTKENCGFSPFYRLLIIVTPLLDKFVYRSLCPSPLTTATYNQTQLP